MIALTGLTVRTEPKRSVGIVSQRLAMERPAINAQEAPFFEEGIAPAQTLVVGRRGPVAKVVEIAGGVISGLCNEPDSAVRRRWRLHHGEG